MLQSRTKGMKGSFIVRLKHAENEKTKSIGSASEAHSGATPSYDSTSVISTQSNAGSRKEWRPKPWGRY